MFGQGKIRREVSVDACIVSALQQLSSVHQVMGLTSRYSWW